ncbi:hypothetical protein GCM10007928_44030 [Sulfitobacter porphyrae]|nr:hypothetical protein GCM10007928_44030 [Sulfitobacter porphyrae]
MFIQPARKLVIATDGIKRFVNAKDHERYAKCQRQSKIGPKGSAKCCHFEGGVMSVRSRASIRATALVI